MSLEIFLTLRICTLGILGAQRKNANAITGLVDAGQGGGVRDKTIENKIGKDTSFYRKSNKFDGGYKSSYIAESLPYEYESIDGQLKSN